MYSQSGALAGIESGRAWKGGRVKIGKNCKFPLSSFETQTGLFVILTAQGFHFAQTHDPSAASLALAAPELLEIALWVQNELPGVIRQNCPLGVPLSVSAVHDAARAVIAKAERGEG
jgi:hypothetical protein